jgi:hypothetical protein
MPGARVGLQERLDVRVDPHQRGVRQAAQPFFEGALVEVVVAVDALEGALQLPLVVREHHEVVLHGEHRVPDLVQRRAGGLARLLRLLARNEVVELVLVLGPDRRDEVVVRLGRDGLRARGAHHQRVAEHGLHVVVEVQAAARLLDPVLEALLDLAAERELPDQLVERLELVAVQVRVDRERERRVLRQHRERRVEGAAGVVSAAASGEREQDEQQDY